MNPPKHVAIIMDGNGRWGLKKKKSRNYGHKQGLETVDKIINAANAQTFDETVFEEVIKCYRMLANLILKNANTIKTNSMKINNLVIQRTKLLKRILSAG